MPFGANDGDSNLALIDLVCEWLEMDSRVEISAPRTCGNNSEMIADRRNVGGARLFIGFALGTS